MNLRAPNFISRNRTFVSAFGRRTTSALLILLTFLPSLAQGQVPRLLSEDAGALTADSGESMQNSARLGQPIPASYFGLHVNGGFANWPPSHGFTKFGTLRLWDNGHGAQTEWSQSYVSGSGLTAAYKFTNLDTWLSLMKTQCGAVGNDCQIIINLGRTPPSMSPYPLDTQCGYQVSGGHGQCYPPVDLVANQACWVNSLSCTTACYQQETCADNTGGPDNHWKGWVSAITDHVARLSPSTYLTTNIIWEPWDEVTSDLATTGGNQWYNRTKRHQEAKLLSDAATIVSANRGTNAWIITTPNTTNWDPANVPAHHAVTLEQQRIFAMPGVGTAAGGISFHGYVSNSGIPEEVARIMADPTYGMSAIVPGTATTYPTYDTEVSWGSGANVTDPDQQKAYLARVYLTGWGFGASSLVWYSWDLKNGAQLWQPDAKGNCTTPVAQGSGFLCPAGIAYQSVYLWMVGNTQVTACSGPFRPARPGVWQCLFQKSDGTRMLAVWDASQTCKGGFCTYSSFNVPSGYVKFATLESPQLFTPVGLSVQIGIKPIFLSQ